MRTRVLVTIPWYLPAYRAGGPIRTIAALVADHGDRTDIAILAGDRDWGDPAPLDVPTDRWVRVGRATVRYCSGTSPSTRLHSWTTALLRMPPVDVVYVQGVFPVWSSMLPAALHRLGWMRGTRLLVAPRGEFGAGALAIGRGRKRAFLAMARAVGLYRGASWHASTPLEAEDIRRTVGDVEVVVRENETLLPPEPLTPPRRRPGPLRCIFLSRISEKKGLHVLLEALARVEAPVELDVYGSADDDRYLESCRRRAAGLPHSVRFHGAVPPEQVPSAFLAADVFVFPTADENFGHSIAESLAASCPVLLPDTTPWTGRVRDGGGAIVGNTGTVAGPEEWASAIDRWAAGDVEELLGRRRAAGDAYRRWRSDRPTASVFDLILGGGS